MLADILVRYLEIFPEERHGLALLQKQITDKEPLNDRRNFTGHITASAVILSPDKQQILLIHHKAYGRWQQPGGHWEPSEANPFEAAKREGSEETGLKLGKNLPLDLKNPSVPVMIDSHPVPARPAKNEPPHYHHDFLYVFLAEDMIPKHQATEVNAAEWFRFDDPKAQNVQKVTKKLQRKNHYVAGCSSYLELLQ